MWQNVKLRTSVREEDIPTFLSQSIGALHSISRQVNGGSSW